MTIKTFIAGERGEQTLAMERTTLAPAALNPFRRGIILPMTGAAYRDMILKFKTLDSP